MRIAAPLPVGSVVVAEEQTAGIGRHGHDWASERHTGLYTSIVLELHPVLTLALGLAAAAAVHEVTSLECDIRWPNDLMLGSRKFGGILVQREGERTVAGIGINVGQRAFPSDLRPLATSLALETNLDFRVEDILRALLAHIERVLPLPTAEVLARWEQASTWAKGKPVRVDLGNRELTGVTAGLDPAGFLRVRNPGGVIELVIAGGVRPF